MRRRQVSLVRAGCGPRDSEEVWLICVSELSDALQSACLSDRDMPLSLSPVFDLRCVAAGQWQYQLAVDLNMQPKMVFHHLKALYKEGLIMHIQLPLPASLRPSHQRGSNLTMSALLWHWRFFDLRCMPPEIQGMVSLHHLQPLQQQVLEMLREAPSQAILESEIHEFCLNAFTSSERVRDTQACCTRAMYASLKSRQRKPSGVECMLRHLCSHFLRSGASCGRLTSDSSAELVLWGKFPDRNPRASVTRMLSSVLGSGA